MLQYTILSLLLRPGVGAKYCDERVCLSVCLSVSLSVCPLTYFKDYTSEHHDIYIYVLSVVAARSSSDDNAMRYVLPVPLL